MSERRRVPYWSDLYAGEVDDLLAAWRANKLDRMRNLVDHFQKAQQRLGCDQAAGRDGERRKEGFGRSRIGTQRYRPRRCNRVRLQRSPALANDRRREAQVSQQNTRIEAPCDELQCAVDPRGVQLLRQLAQALFGQRAGGLAQFRWQLAEQIV